MTAKDENVILEKLQNQTIETDKIEKGLHDFHKKYDQKSEAHEEALLKIVHELQSVNSDAALSPDVKIRICSLLSNIKSDFADATSLHRGIHGNISKFKKTIEKTFVEDTSAFTKYISGDPTKCLPLLMNELFPDSEIYKKADVMSDDELFSTILVEELVRNGYGPVAIQLAKEVGMNEEDVGMEKFREVGSMVCALKDGDLEPAKAWLEAYESIIGSVAKDLRYVLAKLEFLSDVQKCNGNPATVIGCLSKISPYSKDYPEDTSVFSRCSSEETLDLFTALYLTFCPALGWLIPLPGARPCSWKCCFRLCVLMALDLICEIIALNFGAKEERFDIAIQFSQRVQISVFLIPDFKHIMGSLLFLNRDLTNTPYADLSFIDQPNNLPHFITSSGVSLPTLPMVSLFTSAEGEKRSEGECGDAEPMDAQNDMDTSCPSSDSDENLKPNAFVRAAHLFGAVACQYQLKLSTIDPLRMAFASGLKVLPKLYETQKAFTWLQNYTKAGPHGIQTLPVTVELDSVAQQHNIFHCPVEKEVSNWLNPVLRLHCGHAITRDAYNNMLNNERNASGHIRGVVGNALISIRGDEYRVPLVFGRQAFESLHRKHYYCPSTAFEVSQYSASRPKTWSCLHFQLPHFTVSPFAMYKKTYGSRKINMNLLRHILKLLVVANTLLNLVYLFSPFCRKLKCPYCPKETTRDQLMVLHF
ncbi:unnamed protein product [Rodentolepis nana]|uniref:CLTH domain-containing protein n=1 Tax=Rodentolepis nana TaxID=102285 RepID=A0A0R3TRI2_RODNA|nr:unnamed protein product [Rodentolepis nana]